MSETGYILAQIARPKKALTLSEWQRFISVLYELSERDCLMAYLLLYSAKADSLKDLLLSDVDFDKNRIRITRVRHAPTYIRLPPIYMKKLKSYIKFSALHRKDSPLLFVTCHGKGVVRSRLHYALAKAAQIAGVKHMTPYSVRATYIMLVKFGDVDENHLFYF